jgi:hypothetical protein
MQKVSLNDHILALPSIGQWIKSDWLKTLLATSRRKNVIAEAIEKTGLEFSAPSEK